MPADQPDYYAILGVPRHAPVEIIHARYRKLIEGEQPDHVAGQRSRQIEEAYLVLSDPEKRRGYDLGQAQPSPPHPSPVSHGGDVPITGARPGNVTRARPRPNLSQPSIEFGAVFGGRRLTSRISVDNHGGMPSRITIDWETPQSWAHLTVTPDPRYTFPITVDVDIDTKSVPFGGHTQVLIITLDDVQVQLPVLFQAGSSLTAARRSPVSRSAPAAPFKPAHRFILHLTPNPFARALIVGALILVVLATKLWFDQKAGQEAAWRASGLPVPLDAAPASWLPYPAAAFNAASNWEQSPPGNTGGSAYLKQRDGIFEWTVVPDVATNWVMIAIDPASLTAFHATVHVKGPGNGVFVGFIFDYDSPGRYDAFLLSPAAPTAPVNYMVFRTANSMRLTLISDSIYFVFADEYDMEILSDGAWMNFYINGQRVLRTSEIVPHGRLGLYALTSVATGPSLLTFDHFDLDLPQGPTQTP